VNDRAQAPRRGWRARLWSRKAAVLLGRNTVVGTAVFLLGLVLLWLLVEFAHVPRTLAAGGTFLFATTLHYALGRTWIYRGTDRRVIPGYGLFLFNALVGLALTVSLFELFIRYTGIHYLAARTLVSVVAGLAMFLLNGVFNFRKL
jgi:putative flippase GtrA